MPAFRSLVAIVAALSLLAALPVAGAEAKSPTRSAHKTKAKAKAKKKHRKYGRKRGKQLKPAPGAEDPAAIGTITAVDGDDVTVTLNRGGSVTAQVTEATEGACATGRDDEADDDDADLSDDDEGDDDDPAGDEDESDRRSARMDDGCAPAVGAAVYEIEVEAGVFGILDLSA